MITLLPIFAYGWMMFASNIRQFLADVRRVDVRVRMDERGELVIAALAFEVTDPPELVHAAVAERPQQLDLLSGEKSSSFSQGTSGRP